jgi:hypothetical protein
MNWLKNNWQLKLMALGLALFLWLVLHYSAPVTSLSVPSAGWPMFGGVAR